MYTYSFVDSKFLKLLYWPLQRQKYARKQSITKAIFDKLPVYPLGNTSLYSQIQNILFIHWDVFVNSEHSFYYVGIFFTFKSSKHRGSLLWLAQFYHFDTIFVNFVLQWLPIFIKLDNIWGLVHDFFYEFTYIVKVSLNLYHNTICSRVEMSNWLTWYIGMYHLILSIIFSM